MPPVSSAYRLFVGCDVSARTATIATRPSSQASSSALTFEQTPSGFEQLHQHLLTLEAEPPAVLVVMEATGSYWMRLALALSEAQFAVAVINPAQAHDFAKALLKRSKTDAIDAQTLAELAMRLQPKPWSPPPAVSTELHQRLVHRDALVEARTQFRNQLHALQQQPSIVASVEARLGELITTLTDDIAEVDAELASALEHDARWAEAAAYLATIKGLGKLTIAWLLTTTSNFTLTLSAEAAANYAGLVPQLRQSGTSVRGKPAIGHSGNARLRRALYMATLSALQHNPVIKAFYERLIAKGKAKKVAVCACARKLLRIAWAVATKKQAFSLDYGMHHARNAV
jgi:transposase